MTFRVVLLLLLLSGVSSTAPGQRKAGLEKKLEIFWKSKQPRANAITRAVIFAPGDTIADIGTADGWFAAALSSFCDSVVFYLEDIDSAVWNRTAFDTAVQYFSKKQQKISSHQYHYKQGTERSTGLPRNAFDKVLIIDTYHHFSQRDEMVSDAVSLLKSGGKIVILEALARKPGDFHQGCRQPIYSEEEIIAQLESHKLNLQTVRFIHKVAGRKNKLFIFVKK